MDLSSVFPNFKFEILVQSNAIARIAYFLVQNSPSVSSVVSYNLKTFVVRVCSYVLWNPQRLSAAHSFKKRSRTKFEMFLFESSGNSLEENIHFMSQEITVATGKIHSTWLNPGNFLKMIFYFSLFGGDGMNEGWIEQNGYTFSALTNVQSFRLFWTQKICITVAKGK